MILDESGDLSTQEDEAAKDYGNVSDPFAPATVPDPFTQPTKAKQKKATKKAVASVSPEGESSYGTGFGADSTPSDPSLPADESDIGGHKYKFFQVTDPDNNVEFYTAQDPSGRIDISKDPQEQRDLNDLANEVPNLAGLTIGGHGLGDPNKLSDKEYDALTKAAARGNNLARQILIKGHYKATDFPSLTQDLAKVEDPFVNALSNLPNVANAAEAQTVAVTQPYDFNNAEAQVNNILANQGMAQLAQPSATTTQYANKLSSIASQNPLATSALGLPSINQALAGLGPAAQLSEKATPNQGLLAALLSHIQYEDIYGTGLTGPQASSNPAWLQNLISSVLGDTSISGALPSVTAAAAAAGGGSTSPTDTVPNTG
jgi:hypothetical protein